MNHFKINKSIYLPEVKKMDNDQLDYVAYCYEFIFPINEKIEKSLSYIFYTVIDCYEHERNATFNICYEPNTGDTYFYRINQKRKPTSKSHVFILSQHDKVRFEHLDVKTCINSYKDIDAVIEDFVKEINTDLNTLPAYLDSNNIGYDNHEINSFIQDFIEFVKEHHLQQLLPSEYNIAKTQLLAHHLEQSVSHNIKINNTPKKKLKL